MRNSTVMGPIKTLDGNGWIELDGGTIYGEPVSRIRAQGKFDGQVVQLASITASSDAGKATASGSYDLHSRQFHVDARAAGIDLSRVKRLHDAKLSVNGSLGLTITGSGTLDDPRFEAHANLAGLTVSGEPFGGVEIFAHAANHTVNYDVTTRLETAELHAHGQTSLNEGNDTQATLTFSRFNIDALLKLAHVDGLNGESALAGTVTVEGPLARPEEMRGDARLQELAVTIAGVHLRSEGGVHASLANAQNYS